MRSGFSSRQCSIVHEILRSGREFAVPLDHLVDRLDHVLLVTVLRRARIAYMPASMHTERMSAPVVLGHKRASSSKRMSRSQFIERAWIWKMEARPSRSGR